MKKFLLSYLLRISLLTIILGIFGQILFKTILSKFYLPVFWLLLLLFFIVHSISQLVIFFAEKKHRLKFGNAYLLSFFFRFVSYLSFLIIYLSVAENIHMTFAIVFFLMYLIYTLLDVRMKIHFSKTYTYKIEKSD
jgi:hypothetical protein